MNLPQFAALVVIAAASTLPLKAQAQDAAAGEALFGSRCTACHTAEEGGISGSGPNLFGVSGAVASNRGIEFNYSDALIDSGVIWDEGNLDAWLESPDDFVPGNKMPFPGLAAAGERADIIAFLMTLK